MHDAGDDSPAGDAGRVESGGGVANEAFDLVTEETRAAIIEALAAHTAANPRDPTMGFSDLREAAAVADSGNFNYHLDRLRPEFVTRTEEGYRATPACLSLVGTLQAGVGAGTTRGPEPLDDTCRLCGTGLTASYEEGIIAVTCEEGHSYPRDFLPPNAVSGRGLEEALALQTRRTQHHCELIREGVCPGCFDDIEREYEQLDVPRAGHVIVATCEGCGRVSASPVGVYLLREPAVVAFYHDHGVDVTETPLWALELPVAEPTVQSETPLRLSLSVERGGERLRLVVDGCAHLLDSERTTPEPTD